MARSASTSPTRGSSTTWNTSREGLSRDSGRGDRAGAVRARDHPAARGFRARGKARHAGGALGRRASARAGSRAVPPLRHRPDAHAPVFGGVAEAHQEGRIAAAHKLAGRRGQRALRAAAGAGRSVRPRQGERRRPGRASRPQGRDLRGHRQGPSQRRRAHLRRRRGRTVRQPERRLGADDDHDVDRARGVDLLPSSQRRRHRPHGGADRRLRPRPGADDRDVKVAAEEVLCVKRDDIFPDGAWHGFVTENLERHQAVIRERHFFKPRVQVENDPTYQQIIPYVVFRHGERYFLTHRLRASSERRLRKQYSLGVGGHINPGDLGGGDPISDGLKREWEEEVVYEGSFEAKLLGLLNDESSPVSKVHLGVVFLVDGDSPTIAIRETTKLAGELLTLEEMRIYYLGMESWSQMVYDRLLKGDS